MIVVEARGEQGGVSKVVERWGDPDASKCVLAASIDDSKNDPVCVCYYVVFGFLSTNGYTTNCCNGLSESSLCLIGNWFSLITILFILVKLRPDCHYWVHW